MKIRITEHTIAQKRQVEPGDELDVTKQEAAILISVGRAIALAEPAETTSLPLFEKAIGPNPEKQKLVQAKRPAATGTKVKTAGGPPVPEKRNPAQAKNPDAAGAKTKASGSPAPQASEPPKETTEEQKDGLP